MGKKGNRIKPPIAQGKKISEKAIIVTTRDEGNEQPLISFLHTCDRHFLLSDWKGVELDALIRFFKKVESHTWNEIILGQGGLRCKRIDTKQCSANLPSNISLDISLFELRVDDLRRVFGHRVGRALRVIWFDNKHGVLPYHKQRA